MDGISILEDLASTISGCIERIEVRHKGPIGTLSILTDQIQALARLNKSDDLTKLYILLEIYGRSLDAALEVSLSRTLRSKLTEEITVPDPSNPQKTIKRDMSPQFKWIGSSYPDLTSFFGDQSSDFYYQKARKKLVPDYVEDLYFPALSAILVKSFDEAIVKINKLTIGMLDEIREPISNGDMSVSVDVLWRHFLIAYRELIA